MLFNSYAFVLAFVPVTLAAYFLLCKSRLAAYSQLWLLLASLFFYGVWNPLYVPLLLGSIAFNWLVSRGIHARAAAPADARRLLIAGIAANLLLLGYYKYADFFVANLNYASGAAVPLLHVVLPLGISFFTFTQIAFLVDTWQQRATRPGLVNYALFVSYFPHLLAGPILHHREMMPQFEDAQNRNLKYENLARGLLQFALGLAKKVLLADNLAEIADSGFRETPTLGMADAWLTAIAYALQLYFDFSGYTDMAIGVSRMFNIRLPINFDTPYRATSIGDFWRRWHITLSRFLREYVYVPLGGNRSGETKAARNVMITFLLGGLWHGAGWTFVVWGALHGCALVIQRAWTRYAMPLPAWLAWLMTLLFVIVAWVFFRASSLIEAFELLQGMAGRHGLGELNVGGRDLFVLVGSMALATLGPNSNVIAATRPLTFRNAAFAAALLAASILSLSQTSPFIYFNF